MAASQQFCVRWNSHLGSLGAAFPQLLAGGRFVDCTLACEGRQLTCHRLVLAACSGFFESLLGENPCQHPIIILKDVRFWELQALVDFMYKGEVNVTQEGLQDLLKCAETLQIRGLSGADSALKNLSDTATKSDEDCSTSNTNHHLNNVVKEETVPYQEEQESTSLNTDAKTNTSELQDPLNDTNNFF
ncbi:longitudinals lacking protein, isoforms H/M/V-like [Ctenocephalides felis]|uniref:longitudinals lacking protein, isoforms H/M/V-like n=1 Tax=Ctenocephalides felis TaxID=7515 RepID=UPI000E6E46E7|nr:longitudinals lacking protein, isoforms H/M/V-like [Ctenocephalides felis]